MNELMLSLSSASPDMLLDIIATLKEALETLGLLDDYHRAWCKRVERRLQAHRLTKAA
jgi:hypothetical protein